MTKTKLELLNDPNLYAPVNYITDLLADAFDAGDKEKIDLSALSKEVFEDNLTSIYNLLIRLNKDYSKEEITFLLRHYSEYLASASLMLMRASELDY